MTNSRIYFHSVFTLPRKLNVFAWIRCVIVAAVVLLASQVIAQDSKTKSDQDKQPKVEMLTCKVLVLDPDGNPVEDATVYCTGMRTRIEPGSHWGWSPVAHGPLPKLKTDGKGLVEMPYPKYVAEKLETGQMTWSVEHPDFVDFRQDRSVDDDPAEIKLERGFRIAVTAVDGQTGEKIKSDLYAVIGGSRADWKLANNGMLVSPMFAKRNTTLRICQFAEGQPTLFSEAIDIEPGDRSRILLKDVKLSLGTRVEGKIIESVTRPITNGHVCLTIARAKDLADWRSRWGYSDIAPIQEDGTFVFESVPSDEVLQLISVCDGWVPAKPDQASVLKFFPTEEGRLKGSFALPQLVASEGQKIAVELKMEKSTSLRVTVQAPDGSGLPNAEVVMWPNQLWFQSGSQVLGDGYSTRAILVGTRSGGYEWDRKIRYKVVTDADGVGVIDNLPVNVTESIAVSHDDFDMPISGRDRNAEVDLKPDFMAEFTIKMQNKGADALGEQVENKDDGEQQDEAETGEAKKNQAEKDGQNKKAKGQ